MINILLDILVAGLLAATIFYCWKLNRLLQTIRNGESELALLLQAFNDATENAQQSIMELRRNTDNMSEKLQVRIEKAEFIADDLAFLIEKSNKLANTLADSIATAKSVEQQAAPASKPAAPKRKLPVAPAVKEMQAGPKKENKELLGSLFKEGAGNLGGSRKAAIEKIAQKAHSVASKAISGNRPSPSKETEEDLLAALKSMR